MVNNVCKENVYTQPTVSQNVGRKRLAITERSVRAASNHSLVIRSMVEERLKFLGFILMNEDSIAQTMTAYHCWCTIQSHNPPNQEAD